MTDDHLRKGLGAIGATGSGKTYCIRRIVSELRSNYSNYSMVVVQAKDDFDDMFLDGDLILEQGIGPVSRFSTK